MTEDNDVVIPEGYERIDEPENGCRWLTPHGRVPREVVYVGPYPLDEDRFVACRGDALFLFRWRAAAAWVREVPPPETVTVELTVEDALLWARRPGGAADVLDAGVRLEGACRAVLDEREGTESDG